VDYARKRKPMDLEELKELHDKAYQSGQVTRERAAEDLVFFWITHWDDNILDETQLSYRGEFDILRKAYRGILADLVENPVQVDFEPQDDSREDAAEIMDGLYRNSTRDNVSIEAFGNADQESVVSGMGAWLLYTEYVTQRGGDRNQVIKRKPIYEANNTVFWDPNAKLLDKSDADYVSVLFAYSRDGYLKLVNDLTGEAPEKIEVSQFKSPETSLTFPWILGEAEKIYVAKIFKRELVKKKILVMTNPFGQEVTVCEKELEAVMEEMLDDGFEITSEKEVERYEVTQYLCSGKEILSEDVIAGEHLPVIVEYGERAFLEGEEHYEGITRLAKDPQRLRDFQLSYLADIASRSPREKPIFGQEQIAGYENMYSLSGADNNYPYLLQNLVDPNGRELHIGPVATLPAPNIPPALVESIRLSREAVEDVANPGVPQDVADVDLSGKAVNALQARLDKQSSVYQEHRKHARRRDGDVYASMSAEVHDVPREVRVQLPDGTVKTEKIMESVIDQQTGDIVVIKDLRNAEFMVYSTISSSYSSQKEQTLEKLGLMITATTPGDPMRDILMLKSLKLMDGVDFDDVRDYANNRLLLMGIRKPETPEEEELLQQHQQQGEEPSADMVLALAEDKKGQAAMMREQREAMKLQIDAQLKTSANQIDAYEAQIKDFEAQIKAQEVGAKIDKTQAEALGTKIDNQAKVVQLRIPQNMTDDEIIEELAYG
jgi:hypothetical protein